MAARKTDPRHEAVVAAESFPLSDPTKGSWCQWGNRGKAGSQM